MVYGDGLVTCIPGYECQQACEEAGGESSQEHGDQRDVLSSHGDRLALNLRHRRGVINPSGAVHMQLLPLEFRYFKSRIKVTISAKR